MTLRFEFAYDGGLGAGGNGVIFVNGKEVGAGRVEQTQPFAFSAETTDVGENSTRVSATTTNKARTGSTARYIKVSVQVGKPNLGEEAQRAIAEMRLKKALNV